MQRPVLRSPALALDAGKLGGGRYAEFLKLLLDTRRYEKGENDFQLMVDVNLEDGGPPVRVHVELSGTFRGEAAEEPPKTDRRLPGAEVPRMRRRVREPRGHRD